MQNIMNSINIGGMPDEKRRLSDLEPGDTVSVRQLTHRWGEPDPLEPGKPHIANASAKIVARNGTHFSVVFLGRHPKDKPFSAEDVERRLNELGWYRREGDVAK